MTDNARAGSRRVADGRKVGGFCHNCCVQVSALYGHTCPPEPKWKVKR